LAIRDAMKTRDIITSDWYQERWGAKVGVKAGAPTRRRNTS
jgi:hypothetical protein